MVSSFQKERLLELLIIFSMMGNITFLNAFNTQSSFALLLACITIFVLRADMKLWIILNILFASFILSFIIKSTDNIGLLIYLMLCGLYSIVLFTYRKKISLNLSGLLDNCALVMTIPVILQVILHEYQINLDKFIKFETIIFHNVPIIGGGFINPNNTAFYIFVLQVARFVLVSDFKNKSIYELINLLCLFCLIILASRFILVAYLLVFFISRPRAFAIYLSLTFLLLPIFIVFLNSKIFQFAAMKYSTFLFGGEIIENILTNDTLDARFYYLDYFVKFDWIPFGLTSSFDAYAAPHNLIVEISFTLGILGIIYVALYLLVLSYEALSYKGNLKRTINLIYLVIIFSSLMIPSTLLFTPATYTILFLTWASMRKGKNNAF